MRPNVEKTHLAILLLLLVVAGLTGCAGAIRSDPVRQLVEQEKKSLARVNQGLEKMEGGIKDAIEDLKRSHKLYLNNLRLWEKELKRAQIFAASPGDLRNKPVRQAVFTQLAQLEIDRNDAYANLQRDFETQADALQGAYEKILAATAKVEKQLDAVDVYVHKSAFTFFVESIDLTTIQEGLSEFEESKILLQRAAKAGEAIEKALGHAKVVDRNQHMRELIETLSLISSRLQELKQP
ncbi:hypothetical protein GTO10_03230 [Candidatus Saccharibacteria bacterium]|nr:hypothetical protein [candidate division Zixibacteria bacterium]NIT03920.1 hypothetical protein [Candidatus Saccharibacteria bacterium]